MRLGNDVSQRIPHGMYTTMIDKVGSLIVVMQVRHHVVSPRCIGDGFPNMAVASIR